MMLNRLRQWYHGRINQVNSDSSSGVLLQVVVLSAMKPPRLSRRVILQASVWTVVVIVLCLLLLYSLLLTFVDRHVAMSPEVKNMLRHKHYYRKIKFRSKTYSNVTHEQYEGHQEIVWNSSDYYNLKDGLPECHNGSLLTIIITSAADHSGERNEIRQTWCNSTAAGLPPHAWQCIFLIGKVSVQLDLTINNEMRFYGDILRGDYKDSYRNLTYKVLHGFSWSSQMCPTSYTLKTDDDCFVNTLQLYSFLVHKNKVKSDLYVGNVNLNLAKRTVIRDVSSKWSVSMTDYPQRFYPPYASGTGYVLSFDLVQKIVNRSPFIKVIPNEDAYIGILVDSVGVPYISSPRFALFNDGLRLCNYLYIFVSHGVLSEKQRVLFAQMLQAPRQCTATGDELNTWL